MTPLSRTLYDKPWPAPGVAGFDGMGPPCIGACRGAPVAGGRFGRGSRREPAPCDLGVRCVIAASLGEIFCSSCFKNSLPSAVVQPDAPAPLMAGAEAVTTVSLETWRPKAPPNGGAKTPWS